MRRDDGVTREFTCANNCVVAVNMDLSGPIPPHYKMPLFSKKSTRVYSMINAHLKTSKLLVRSIYFDLNIWLVHDLHTLSEEFF